MGVSKYNADVIKYGDTLNVPAGGGGLAASVQTSNYTITEDEDVGVDSSGGTFTITLKASPSAGDVAIIRDVGQNCGTTNVAIARNGSTINGAATDENLDVDNGMYMFVYNGSTWKFTPFSGPGLNEAEVVAVTSGLQRQFLRPEHDLARNNAGAPALDYHDSLGTYGVAATYTFSAAGDETIYWITAMPRRWDLGTMRFRFYWKPESTNTGVCRWRALPTNPANDGETMFGSVGSGYNADDAALGVTGNLQITGWTTAMSQVSAAVAGDLISVIFQRNGAAGADTFTGTATLIGIEVEWTSNAPTDD